MEWTIHHWSSELGCGIVECPVYGQIPFDDEANIDKVRDFKAGESVLVELDRNFEPARVRMVRLMFQRQPSGTRWPPFDFINRQRLELIDERRTATTLRLSLGVCCTTCTRFPVHVHFEDVASILGLDYDLDDDLDDDSDQDWDEPYFRLASESEINDHRLVIPDGSRAFCIIPSHGYGLDGTPVFVVAREVLVVQGADRDAPDDDDSDPD